MKRIFAVFLSVLCCMILLVPAYAIVDNTSDETAAASILAEIIISGLDDISYQSLEIDGKKLDFTTGKNADGYTVTVTESADLIVIATENDAGIDSVVIERSTLHESSYTYDYPTKNMGISSAKVQPRYTIGAESLYWGYSYRVSDAEELEEGLLWDLECGAPLYDSFYGYDDNDATARAYAEDFMDYVNSMLDHQEAARTIDANAIDSFFASIADICTNPGAVAGAVANAAASIREAEDQIVSASRDSEQALYCFRRFIAIAHPLFP